MSIQDLGAIGEFISSVVIVITLMVLIYEIRGAKRATLQANAQERGRKQDVMLASITDAPQVAATWYKADKHLGGTDRHAVAREFGLEPNEWMQLSTQFARMLAVWREAYFSELSDSERKANDFVIATTISTSAAFRKYYETNSASWRSAPSADEFVEHVDQLLAD